MEKFIFLDLDGVFNYHKWWDTEIHYEIYRTKGELESHYDPMIVKNFNRILNNVPEAKVILITSWKSLTSTELKPYGDYPNGISDVLLSVGIKRVDGKVPSIFCKRDEEIVEFLKDYNDYKFVIIDDEDYYTSSKYHDKLYNNWIRTSSSAGLTKEISDKVIKLLTENG